MEHIIVICANDTTELAFPPNTPPEIIAEQKQKIEQKFKDMYRHDAIPPMIYVHTHTVKLYGWDDLVEEIKANTATMERGNKHIIKLTEQRDELLTALKTLNEYMCLEEGDVEDQEGQDMRIMVDRAIDKAKE